MVVNSGIFNLTKKVKASNLGTIHVLSVIRSIHEPVNMHLPKQSTPIFLQMSPNLACRRAVANEKTAAELRDSHIYTLLVQQA